MILINLLSYTFIDLVYMLLFTIFFTFLWLVYYIYTNSITVPKVESLDVNVKKNTTSSNNIFSVITSLSALLLLLMNYAYIQNFSTLLIFWDALYSSNNTVLFLVLSLVVLFLITTTSLALNKQNISFNVEYILFIYIIIFSGYLLISSTNLFISIFFLEFVALLIFGKFTVSKTIFNNNKANNNTHVYITQYSYGLFNSLFFQFWANFVSSIFLFFSLINVHYMFGTSNFFLLNFLFNVCNNFWVVTESFIQMSLIVFITGLFIKLGLSPYQFFKIETYKGIPLFMVIVYTTLYLIIYIYFFIYLVFYQLPIIKVFTSQYLLSFITLSLLYLVSLLFDTKNFKAFLSYSTLITIVNLLLVILVA